MSRFIDNLDYFEKRYKQELKAALKSGENREWVLRHAKVSKMTYDRHLWNNPDLSELNRQLKEQRKEKELESAKVTTICIDMKTCQRYEFKKRILCDRKFGWRDGATAALINKAGKRKTTRLYRNRYLVFDAKDEDKYEL